MKLLNRIDLAGMLFVAFLLGYSANIIFEQKPEERPIDRVETYELGDGIEEDITFYKDGGIESKFYRVESIVK